MQPPSKEVPTSPVRVRVAAGLMSLALGAIYTLQLDAAFDRGAYLGGLFIGIACLQIIYGMILLMQPWAIDSIGRTRPDAVKHGRQWVRVGIGGNLALIVLLSASLAGAIPALSNGVLEFVSIVLGSVQVVMAIVLERSFR